MGRAHVTLVDAAMENWGGWKEVLTGRGTWTQCLYS